jgi:hypothetical protein
MDHLHNGRINLKQGVHVCVKHWCILNGVTLNKLKSCGEDENVLSQGIHMKCHNLSNKYSKVKAKRIKICISSGLSNDM